MPLTQGQARGCTPKGLPFTPALTCDAPGILFWFSHLPESPFCVTLSGVGVSEATGLPPILHPVACGRG
jgi:hypothetical protein